MVSYEPDDDVKAKKLVTLKDEVIPFYLEKLDDIAKENNGFLALGKVIKKENTLITMFAFFLKGKCKRKL